MTLPRLRLIGHELNEQCRVFRAARCRQRHSLHGQPCNRAKQHLPVTKVFLVLQIPFDDQNRTGENRFHHGHL